MLKNIIVRDNRLWRSQLQLGYSGAGGQDMTVEGNWIGQERMQVQAILSPTVHLNRFAADNNTNVTLVLPKGTGIWDQNSYWHAVGSPFDVNGVGFKTFPQWQAYTGWDATSAYTGMLPTSNWMDVQPWGANRGRVAIFNWTGAPTITLDLSALALTPGASYRLVNAQNVAGQTALILAAERGHVATVRLLLMCGADDSLRILWSGATAADIARQNGHAGVASLLERWRSTPNQRPQGNESNRAMIWHKLGSSGYIDLLQERLS